MNGRGRVLPTVVACVAAVALLAVGRPDVPSGPAVAPVADRAACPVTHAGTVPAGALAGAVPVDACGLAGSVVTAGPLTVRIPADGETVTAAGSGRDAHPVVLTVAHAAGRVHARLWGPDATQPGIWQPELWPPDRQPDRPAGPAPRSRFGRADGQPSEIPPTEAQATGSVVPATSVRCGDSAGAWLGMRWSGTYRWTLRTSGIPAYLGAVDPVRQAILAAGQSVDEGRNDCGLAGDLALSQRYTGETDRDAGVRADGSCGSRDQRNVVAFGRLDGGLLALTCLWWSRGRTVESDIRISDVPGTFTLDPTVGCTGAWDLQGTVTHEFGHVFGLGHVPFAEHGELTMSDGLPACSAGFRNLGLGDYQTLRDRYGTT